MMQQKMGSRQKTVQSVEQTIDNLVQSVQKMEGQNIKLKRDLHNQAVEKVSLISSNEKNEETMGKLIGLSSRLHKKFSEQEIAMNDIVGSTIRDQFVYLDIVKKQNEMQTARFDSLQTDLIKINEHDKKKMEEMCHKFDQITVAFNEKTTSLDELRKECDTKGSELVQFKKRLDDLQNEHDTKECEVVELKKMLDQQESEYDQLNSIMKSLKTQLDEKIKEDQDLKASMKSLEGNSILLEAKILGSDRKLKESQQECNDLKRQVEDMNSALTTSKEEEKNLNDKFMELNDKLATSKEEENSLNDKLKEMSNTLTKSKEEEKNLGDHIKDMSNALATSKEVEKNLNDKLKRLEEHAILMEAKVLGSETKLKKSQQECEDLNLKSQEMDNMLAQSKEEEERLRNKIMGMDEMVAKFKEEDARLNAKMMEMDDTFAKSKEEQAQLINKMKEMDSVLAKSKEEEARLNNKITETNEMLVQSNEDAEKMNSKLLDSKVKTLMNKLTLDHNEKIGKKNKEIAMAKDEVESLRKKLEETLKPPQQIPPATPKPAKAGKSREPLQDLPPTPSNIVEPKQKFKSKEKAFVGTTPRAKLTTPRRFSPQVHGLNKTQSPTLKAIPSKQKKMRRKETPSAKRQRTADANTELDPFAYC